MTLTVGVPPAAITCAGVALLISTGRIKKSQAWYLMHRLVDDYAYHSIVRPKALKMIRENKWNSFRLTDEQTKTVEEFCLTELKPFAAKIASEFSSDYKNVCSIDELTFNLPWNRTFEAEIDFKLQCPQ